MRPDRRDRGAASIEFVGVIPMVFIGMLMLLQLLFVVYTSFAADQAARDASRAYSLGRSPDEAASRSLPSSVRLIRVDPAGGYSGVRVVVEGPHFLPGVDGRVERTVVMP